MACCSCRLGREQKSETASPYRATAPPTGQVPDELEQAPAGSLPTSAVELLGGDGLSGSNLHPSVPVLRE